MGAEVPVLTVAQPTVDGQPAPGVTVVVPFTYRSVGTNITCTGQRLEGDRYQQIRINIDETSVYGDDRTSMNAVMAPGAPVFRSF